MVTVPACVCVVKGLVRRKREEKEKYKKRNGDKREIETKEKYFTFEFVACTNVTLLPKPITASADGRGGEGAALTTRGDFGVAPGFVDINK